MVDIIESSRSEMLTQVRAKRATALRYAQLGDLHEEAHWLHIASRMTEWIEHLETLRSTRGVEIPLNPFRLPARRVARAPKSFQLELFEPEEFGGDASAQ